MPPAKKPAHVYRRPGRAGLFAYLDRDHRHIPLHTDDEAEAQRKLGALLDARRVPQAPKGTHPLADLFDLCHERAVAAHTRKTAYEVGLNLDRVLGFCEGRGVVGVEQVTQTLVEDYKTARCLFPGEQPLDEDGKPIGRKPRKVSAARVNRELDSWRKAMRIAVEEQRTAPAGALDWFGHLREPRPAPHQARLGKAPLERFFRHVAAAYRPMLRAVLGSGMRDEEMRHLDASDLLEVRRGKERWLQVSAKPAGWCACCPRGWATKGYRYRKVPVTKATLSAARSFLAARAGLSLDPKTVWKVIQAGCAAAKVPAFSMHDLRRAWATGMLDAGNKLQQVSYWLGHRDVLTTMRYLGIADHEMPAPGRLPW